MAEIELNVLMGQCLNRRIATIDEIKKEVKAWEEYRNNREAKINWHFTTDDARIKLRRLYPTFKVYDNLLDNFVLSIQTFPLESGEDMLSYFERLMKHIDNLKTKT